MSASAHILLLCAQGGAPEAELNVSIGAALRRLNTERVAVSIASLRDQDAALMQEMAPAMNILEAFEGFRRRTRIDNMEAEVARLARDYKGVNWWLVAAGERSFIDASLLVGGLGQRVETQEYVEALLVYLVCYFEAIFAAQNFTAIMCPEADSLIQYVLFHVARHRGVRVLAMTPNAWIREDGLPGFFFCRDEFLHSDRMEETYRQLGARAITAEESSRVQRFRNTVVGFDVRSEYRALTKSNFVVSALSPMLKRLPAYLWDNAARDTDVEYFKIDVVAKAKANLLRSWRRWRAKHLMGSMSPDIPPRSVFYGMQYQPEQSTLVGGNFFANQVATIENIAKCLPLGYTLIVKEHPRGRGARPAWQYRHLAHFPNVQFCDADSKEILKRTEASVTIAGTIGLEAIAMDKPSVVLGDVYFDFADFVYRAQSWPDLARILRRILIEREYEKIQNRNELIDRFFLAYLIARIPVLLSKDSDDAIAEAVFAELGISIAETEQVI
jgi:Capsule polysaccharide biosynthesis protein